MVQTTRLTKSSEMIFFCLLLSFVVPNWQADINWFLDN